MNIAPEELRRILVIEDSPIFRRLVRRTLVPEGVEVLEASDGREGLAIARVERLDLILLDVNLPGPDGFETLRQLKEDAQTSSIPVIFLSAISDTRQKVQGLDLGAVDFVAKPFEPIDLRARVRVALRAKSMQDLLEQRAHLDALTGLGNRHALEDRLRDRWDACQERGVPLAALVVDLDGFKAVNDRLGHPAGDAILRGTARALRDATREGDFVARLGGDEFIVIAPDCDPEGASAIAERFRRRLALVCRNPDMLATPITASVGGSVSSILDDGPDALLRRADAALYRAKASGRDAVHLDRDEASVPPVLAD